MHCRCIFNEFSFIQIYTVEFYYYAEVLDKKIQFTYWKSAVDATHRIPLNSKQKKAEWTNAARGACVHLSERVLKCAAWNTSLIYWIPWNLWIDCSQVDPLNSHSLLLCLHPSCMHSIDRLCAERECVYPHYSALHLHIHRHQDNISASIQFLSHEERRRTYLLSTTKFSHINLSALSYHFRWPLIRVKYLHVYVYPLSLCPFFHFHVLRIKFCCLRFSTRLS